MSDEVHHVRRAVEVPKAIAAAAVLALTTWIAADGVPGWEADVFESVNGLSGWLVPLLWAPMQLGSLFGPAIVAIGSWIAWRRWRPTVGAIVVDEEMVDEAGVKLAAAIVARGLAAGMENPT